MQMFAWNSDYETGIEMVDEQHQKLVTIINEYSLSLSNNSTSIDDVNHILNRLLEYTKIHFQEEELLMYNMGLDCRHTRIHKQLHKEVINELCAMQTSNSSETLFEKTYILDFIIHWLAYHILGTDMNMSRQIKAIQSGLSAEESYDKEETEKDKSTEPLIQALNGIFTQISVRNKKLIELNETLEKKVRLRTEELLNANKKLEILSLTDPLTNMHNRRYAMQYLELLWEKSKTSLKPTVCIMIDADYFKQINDTYGHDIGDCFLKKLGVLLNHSIRNDDIACRLGGDEFLIICPDTDFEGGMHLAELILKNVSLLQIQSKTPDEIIYGSISIGVSMQTVEMQRFEELIKVADKGIYLAKSNGRGCIKSIQ